MTQLLTTFVEFSIDTAKSAIFTSHVIAAAIGPVVLALYDIIHERMLNMRFQERMERKLTEEAFVFLLPSTGDH